ncbi:hypothetical protein K2173_025340 [Erythroxylum novogranatense]|uniref:RING-type E3 ubiquitin transferase n=1 Tax=Erythroxylum novogranatense TaxID=1862640 RepID=A0AAV8UHK5_9ROSI|nr:hypothetical protein K2173_025340 [Erythroxylum novogranatense]
MSISQTTFLLFFLQIVFAIRACPNSRCSGDNITVRFPFRLEGQQLQDCGFPGFNLSCNNQNMTVLKLPYSGEFLVRGINYPSQGIQLYDSDNCLAKRLLNFNLSGSPFVAPTFQSYTFLSCPTPLVGSRLTTIDCLSNSTISVLATSSISLVNSMSKSNSCRIIVTLPIPVSFPVDFSEGFSSQINNDLYLTWYEPDCAQCEAQGAVCGFQGNKTELVGCSSSPKTGGSNKSLQVFKIICMSIAVPSVVLAAGIALFAFVTDRRPRINAARWNTSDVSPQPTNMVAGLDESTILSYQELVLGESKRLPGPNDTKCPICLSEYQSKETVRCIPECHHCFHAECIDEWLRRNGTCPVCRNSLPPAGDSSVVDGSEAV